jgi:type IV pilus assembly protein PilN
MIRINLFPFRAARIKENIRRQVTIYILSVVFIILVMGYYFMNLNSQVKSLQKERDDKKKELATYQEATAKIKALKSTIADVDIKLKTIRELEKGKTGPVMLLDDIAMSIPKNKLWLTAFKEDKGTIVLEGMAMDNETVADFMDRLENTESLSSVELVNIKQKEIKGSDLNLKDFSLKSKTYAYKEEVIPQETGKKKKGKK